MLNRRKFFGLGLGAIAARVLLPVATALSLPRVETEAVIPIWRELTDEERRALKEAQLNALSRIWGERMDNVFYQQMTS